MGTDNNRECIEELSQIQQKKEQFQKELQDYKKIETEFGNNFFNDMKEIDRIKEESNSENKVLTILDECQATLIGIKKRTDAWCEEAKKNIDRNLKQLEDEEIQLRYKQASEGNKE